MAADIEETEEAPDDALAAKARFDSDIKRYEESYLNTGNPLYVWKAIKSVSSSHVGILSNVHEKHQFPEWCLKYLYDTSHRLLNLGRLRDIAAVDDDYYGPSPRIPARRAPELLAKALGLTRSPGKSAFLEFSTALEYANDGRRLNHLRSRGVSGAEALGQVLDGATTSKGTGLSNERSLQRRIAKARRHRLIPSNEDPKQP